MPACMGVKIEGTYADERPVDQSCPKAPNAIISRTILTFSQVWFRYFLKRG